jgi:hypothetical protein
MTDPVLTVLTQIEIDLQTLVIPSPVPPQPIPDPLDTVNYPQWQNATSSYKAGMGTGTADLNSVKTLLAALYTIDFVKDVGSTTLPPIITKVGGILVDIADKLGSLGSAVSPSAIAGLKTFLNAIQNLPGSPPELANATDILNQITGLLNDVPSARNELYMIAQQLQVFANTFANPS